MAWLTPNFEAGIVCRPLCIPEPLVPHVTGALLKLIDAWSWEQFGDMTVDDVLIATNAMMETYFRGNEMIGVILPYACSTCPTNMLACNGDTYSRVDYPDLYSVIDASYIIDADNFITPNLVDRFVMGTETEQGTAGGEMEHTLTSGEMPAHGHQDTGHTHSEVPAVGAIINGGLEAPAVSAVPGIGVTGIGFASLANTGGGGAHNNLPPYHKSRFGIIWR